ncbi:hypothetical protein [Actinoplanes xinjiangensis]|uniref:hypothetical protein n=1 Tax=Actinoplanes xinjiangensis TaxID=512350 RepID=UPI003447BCC8
MPEDLPTAPAEPAAQRDTATTSTVTGRDTVGPPAGTTTPVQVPKLCRGCGEQMPTICAGCSRKTTAYCRRCLQDGHQPAPARQPRPLDGLEQAITAVMRVHPLPRFGGITGWTAGRLGVHLPGHPPTRIRTALRRLAAAGTAALIGDDPDRFRLTD